MPIEYGGLPFSEAIDYLQDKVNLPTQSWTDIWEGQHAKAFTVAGAMKAELLTDFHAAINTAIKDGMTLEQFRVQFDEIVKRHGWVYNGGRNWRSRVIYQTNMRTAYQAGRYKQQQATKARRPYWQYVHSDLVVQPRPHHLAWDGMVLEADDPWWSTHYPPNGWGCECSVRALSKRDLARLGKEGPDRAPEIVWEEKTVGVRGPNPRTVSVPQGIDPGWGYNVGQATYGRTVAKEVMDQWEEDGSLWIREIQKGFAEAGRPAEIPWTRLPTATSPSLNTAEDMVTALERELGGPEKIYTVGGVSFVVNARALAEHIAERGDFRRSEYFSLIDDAMSSPYEAWLNFEKHPETGKVRLVARMVKGYDIGQGRALIIVTVANKQQLVSHTMITTRDLKYANRQRQGKLIYSQRKDE